MKVHLTEERELCDQDEAALPSIAVLGNFAPSPEVALQRMSSLEAALALEKATGGRLKRYYIPMLEATLALGDLPRGRQVRDMAIENGDFADEDLPRWHELNLALALAGHEPQLADEHACKLLELAEHHEDETGQRKSLKRSKQSS